MAWSLSWIVGLRTLPGFFVYNYLRIIYLTNPRMFKLFVGQVRLCIGGRLLNAMTERAQAYTIQQSELVNKFAGRSKRIREQHRSQAAAGFLLKSGLDHHIYFEGN